MATYPPRRLLGARPLPSDPRRDPRRSGFTRGGGGRRAACRRPLQPAGPGRPGSGCGARGPGRGRGVASARPPRGAERVGVGHTPLPRRPCCRSRTRTASAPVPTPAPAPAPASAPVPTSASAPAPVLTPVPAPAPTSAPASALTPAPLRLPHPLPLPLPHPLPLPFLPPRSPQPPGPLRAFAGPGRPSPSLPDK
ncbi:unnamed protein product [Nyctereutes procyonoides]|uniref:(raccoon dog) hypothetical protein n=1 Tax=Nyctereutes procyonoides TaxID=34880 RepID=A0A811YHF0_NYCPR|nr:unnamed protein product [Nyctereutes procyonoides]